MFYLIGSREEGYARKLRQTCYAGNDQVLEPGQARDGAVAHQGLECSDSVDEALRYIASTLLSKLHTLVEHPAVSVQRREAE